MPLNDEVRLRHLVEAARKAVSYAADRSRADLDDDELLRLALTKLVETVGEAAKHISDDFRESRPGGALVGGFADARPAHSPLLRHQPRRTLEHSDRRPAQVIGDSAGSSNH